MNKPPSTLHSFIWHFLKKHRLPFSLFQLGSFAWTLDHTLWPAIFMLLISVLTQHEIDRSSIFTYLFPVLFLGASLWILVEIGFRLSGFAFAKLSPQLEAEIRMSLFNHVQHHSYNYFSNSSSGNLANKINDLPQAVSKVLQLVCTLFIPVSAAVLISTGLFAFVSPMFALILFIWVGLHLGTCFAFAGRCDALSSDHADARSILVGKIVDSLTNHLNVRLFARHHYELRYLETFQKSEQEKHWKSLLYIEKIKFVLGILSFIFPGVIINAYMLISWKYGNLSTAEVVFIFNTTWNITMMVWLAGLEMPNLFKEMGVANQALSLFKVNHDIVDKPGARVLKVPRGEIIFDKVTFHHTPNKTLFQNKSLSISPAEKIGLVGFSGSGKTTFINLILRHFDVQKGKIFIDGQDISQVTLNSLREAIAMIPQEPLLFHRTLMENIRYGKLTATDEEVFEASLKAHCHDFITKLPEGYQTLVGERGIKLSGGQKQRIAIARAILKNAPVLILDEATSALDSVTEKHIQNDLAELMQGRTAIVIAHRLSTIATMDRILVFDNGLLVEEGTHEELIALGGSYASMWQMQAGGFLPAYADAEEYEGEDYEF
jgi:ATP-binding cassette subfamily B protein